MNIVLAFVGVVVFGAAIAGVVEITRGIRNKKNSTLWFGILLIAPLAIMVILNFVVVTFFAGFR